jgi:hypothetical protein
MFNENASASGKYTVECRDQNGQIKWSEDFDNTVVTAGVQDMNTKYFTGSSYTAAWYLGLITGPGSGVTIVTGDTMSSHAGWSENTSYSQSTRPACTFGTASTANPSVISNTSSTATFSINGSATIAGAFLTSNNTKGGTTGTLFSAAKFQSPGDRSVVNGDTLTVTYTFSLTGN